MSNDKMPYAADLAPSEARVPRGASPAAYGMSTGETFPRLLARLATERADATALQEKRYGIWQPLTWAQYWSRVRDFAHGLGSLGVERGEIVAVIGDNRPEWLIAELAAQSIGAAVVGIYPTSIGEELHHILSLANVKVVVAEDQEQVDKLIRLRAEAASGPVGPLRIETVVYYDPHGLEQYPEPWLRDFTEVEAAGRDWAESHADWLDEHVAAGQASDVAVICTTSGTTSKPKLAELSHANLLAMAEHLTSIDPIGPKDRYVSFLPFAWIGEQMLAVACGLSKGLTLSFPEDSATQKTDLREIGPNVMFSPPRIWESMLSEVQVRIDEAGRLKRAIFGWGYDVGDRVAERRIRGILRGYHTSLESAADAQTPSARRRVGVAPRQARRDPRHLEERHRTVAPVRRGRGLRAAHRGRVGGPAGAVRQAQFALPPLPALVAAGDLGCAVRERHPRG